jgi:hypothetical protein
MSVRDQMRRPAAALKLNTTAARLRFFSQNPFTVAFTVCHFFRAKTRILAQSPENKIAA